MAKGVGKKKNKRKSKSKEGIRKWGNKLKKEVKRNK
jgi:hypothetical protein